MSSPRRTRLLGIAEERAPGRSRGKLKARQRLRTPWSVPLFALASNFPFPCDFSPFRVSESAIQTLCWCGRRSISVCRVPRGVAARPHYFAVRATFPASYPAPSVSSASTEPHATRQLGGPQATMSESARLSPNVAVCRASGSRLKPGENKR